MKQRAIFAMTAMAMIVAAAVPPWLALREARQQAYHTEAALAASYAGDVLRRTDETGRQAFAGLARLARSGHPPCSAESQALMRMIDLTSTYIQAVGYVQGTTLVCSSLGDGPAQLGDDTFHSSTGTLLHMRVPLGGYLGTPLIGIQRGDFVALFHRELPLDTWTAVPDASLAVVHTEMPPAAPPLIHRGVADGRWLARLGRQPEATFVSGQHLVALVRSRHFPIVSVAAVPIAHLQHRTDELAQRLVPAGLLAGLALAGAIFLLARRQMSLANALRQGLRRDEFFLVYQPVVELATGRWVGTEALLRWRRPTGEMISPDLFIPVAEQTGTVVKLTERVLELVCGDVGDFLVRHPAFHIALNLSAADLESPRTVELLDRLLHRTGARPSNLIVEVTERALLDMEATKPVIAALRGRGIEVAVDDFGTGYSSLAYLESLELDFLKIDRAFIEAIGTRAPTSQVVHHIIGMARTMELRMIAEGVETDAQAEYLLDSGVQFAQGWLFARGMPWEELHAALERHGFGSTRAAANMR